MTLDNSGRRAAILRSCDQLRALLASVSRAATLDAVQALGRIRWRAESESETGLRVYVVKTGFDHRNEKCADEIAKPA
jgi:hypothetical protein